MAVSGGYPGEFQKGFPISGLDLVARTKSLVFHAATLHDGDRIITNGGRVLCVTSFGEDIDDAVSSSKEMLEAIEFEEMYFRKDIGYEFI